MFSFHQININVLMNLPVLEVHFHIPVPLRVFLRDHMSPPPLPRLLVDVIFINLLLSV